MDQLTRLEAERGERRQKGKGGGGMGGGRGVDRGEETRRAVGSLEHAAASIALSKNRDFYSFSLM